MIHANLDALINVDFVCVNSEHINPIKTPLILWQIS